jgi:hypothetical protein
VLGQSETPGKRQCCGKLRAIGAGAAHRFLEHALVSRGLQAVNLPICRLQISTDAGLIEAIVSGGIACIRKTASMHYGLTQRCHIRT